MPSAEYTSEAEDGPKMSLKRMRRLLEPDGFWLVGVPTQDRLKTEILVTKSEQAWYIG
jgi:hypothetical protein